MKRITPTQAKSLNDNFVKTRSKAIDKAIGKKDAISSWFSLEEIKDYIDYVEKEAKDRKITINGIRVYFGAYGKNEDKSVKKNMSTVFMVPTTPKQGSQQKDGSGDPGGTDVGDMDGLNMGTLGDPPSATYPQ